MTKFCENTNHFIFHPEKRLLDHLKTIFPLIEENIYSNTLPTFFDMNLEQQKTIQKHFLNLCRIYLSNEMFVNRITCNFIDFRFYILYMHSLRFCRKLDFSLKKYEPFHAFLDLQGLRKSDLHLCIELMTAN